MRKHGDASPSSTPKNSQTHVNAANRFSRKIKTSPQEWTDQELERQYDLSPIKKKKDPAAAALTIDPWEGEKRMHGKEEVKALVIPR